MFAILEPNSAIPSPRPNQDASRSQKPPTKPSRRREKPQLSCTLCRQKKLKCDRVKPCLNCTKRGQPESCDYVKQDFRGRSSRQQGTTDVQDRVRHLEDMVRTLLNGQAILDQDIPRADIPRAESRPAGSITDDGFTPSAASSPAAQADPSIPDISTGRFTRAKEKGNFVGNEHWEAILDDITELKIDLETPDTSQIADFKPQILFGTHGASRFDIMSSIPARPICDMLISRWFRTLDMAPLVVHAPTFMKEYDKLFREPDETPLMWIGLLFAILGQASYFYAVSGEELHNMPEPYTSMWEMSSMFRERTAQCLVEANYLRPGRYTVETLCLYYAVETLQGKASEFGSYVVFGIIVRVAMRLGYHRDASHYPSISPFDGEMQRRAWSLIFQLDLMTSAQVGLPRMIRDNETDTAEPKNLLDADIHESMTELPHPRPNTEATAVAFSIFKLRILRQLGLIVDQLNSITPPPYSEVMRLDSSLMSTHATLPPHMTMRPLSLSITDDAKLILQRFVLEGSFQKSRCVLHRKYLIPGKSNPLFRYSRTASVDAAMRLLDVQLMFHEASQPGGQLDGERWRGKAVINGDYILAAMILCLDLASGEVQLSDEGDEIEVIWPRGQRLQRLRTSHELWCKASGISDLAAKAAEALRIMLKDLSDESAPATSTSTSDAQHNEQTYLGTFNNLDPNAQYFAGSSATDFLAGSMDAEMNFDWGLWDSQFQTTPMAVEDFGTLTFQ